MLNTTYKIKINGLPAKPDVIDAISQIEVEDNGSMADIFRLKILIDSASNDEWSSIVDENFQPLTEIHIAIKVGSESISLIKGYVTDQKIHIDNEPGGSYLEIIGIDATCLMNLEHKIKEWSDMADSDIASAIFSEYGFKTDIEPTQPVHSDIKIIQRGTDIQFLRMLAQRNGYECYVESDPIIGEITGFFKQPRLLLTPQKDLAINFGSKTNVKTIDFTYTCLKPTTAETRQVDIKNKSVNVSKTKNSTINILGKKGVLNLLSKKPHVLLRSSGFNSSTELQTLCDTVVNNTGWAITATGEVDVTSYKSIIRSKRTIPLKGAGSLFSGIYYVARVFHTVTRESYIQRFEIKRNALGLTGSEQFCC